MLVRSRSRNRARGAGSSFDNELLTLLSYGASDAWDFVANQYIRGGVLAPSGITVTRASSGYAQREDGIWVNFASGAARRTDKGLLVEGARTNRALHSRDLTQAAWTATTVTVARNQVGIDGTANSACSLTATAGNGTVLQAVTDTSKARYFSVWIKRITGTGTVEVTLDNGSTWTAVTVTSAYTRVGATQTLADPTFGVRLVTDTDAVAVDFAQLEDAAFPSSPIATAGSSATRAADSVLVNPYTFPAPFSAYAEYVPGGDVSSINEALLFPGGSSSQFISLGKNTGGITNQRAAFWVVNTTDQAFLAHGNSTAVVGSIVRQAVRVGANDFASCVSGGTVLTDTSGTVTTVDRIQFGGNSSLFGYLRRAAIFDAALSDAVLQAVTS